LDTPVLEIKGIVLPWSWIYWKERGTQREFRARGGEEEEEALKEKG
jgi:hypothetical protein